MACKGVCTDKNSQFVDIKKDSNLNMVRNTRYSKPILVYFYKNDLQDSVDLRDILKEYFEGSPVQCTIALVESSTDETQATRTEFGISSLPAAIIINSMKKVLHRFHEVDPVQIYSTVESISTSFAQQYEKEKTVMFEKIKTLLENNKVMVFMKGTPQSAECGFSEKLVAALDSLGIKYHSYNVMAGEDGMRNWIKEYSKWPTIPQVFVEGKIIGGLEKVKEMTEDGSLLKMVPKECLRTHGEEGVEDIIAQNKLVLFITSNFSTDEEQADRSARTVNYLQAMGLHFVVKDAHQFPHIPLQLANTLGDGKTVALPALVKEGKLIGSGSQLYNDAKEQDFSNQFDSTMFRQSVTEEIDQLIASCPVFLFMKGSPAAPQCGFSSKIVQILNDTGVEYKTFDILKDQFIREKLKEYKNWKTYPQLYIKGELMGGLDVVKELIEDGEFQTMTSELPRAK